jgi:hypothetical protein
MTIMRNFTHVGRDHDEEEKAYENYYINQCGHGMPVFYGAKSQRGHGIGAVLGGLWRTVFPILKKVAPVIGRTVLNTGAKIARDVARDVADGRSFGESAKAHVLEAVENGINKIASVGETQSGSGIHRRPATKRKKQIGSGTKWLSKQKKKKHTDIFS